MLLTRELAQAGLAHLPTLPEVRTGCVLNRTLGDYVIIFWLVTVLSSFRETAPRTIFQRVLDILKRSARTVELACRDPSRVEHLASSLQLITECFRCLRNACIECSVNQNSIRWRACPHMCL